MWNNLKTYNKTITKNTNLSQHEKLAGARSVAFVHLEWNCHVWPPLTQA